MGTIWIYTGIMDIWALYGYIQALWIYEYYIGIYNMYKDKKGIMDPTIIHLINFFI